MRILHAAAEFYPIVRTGGLGDVLAALPPAQAAIGLDPRIILPGFPAVTAALDRVDRLEVSGAVTGVSLLRGRLPGSGLVAYAVDAPSLYGRPGNPYLGPDGRDWPDNALRFGLFGQVAAWLAQGRLDPGWRAEVLHAHDWHAGLAPAYLALSSDADANPVSVFTVHNLAFQGLFPATLLAPLGLPAAAFTPDGLEFWGRISFIKAGLVYADRVTTVSPGYAREIATPEFGCGLDGVIAGRGSAVSGILNGVDEAVWNPAEDPAIAQPYDAGRLALRAADRTALLDRFGLAAPPGPLYGVVSRMTAQKGLDLLLAALPTLLESGGGLVLLGSGDAPLEAAFLAEAAAAPTRIGVVIGYDDALSHAVMAGADAILVPSRFEPCGLTQLYALRYGAVPVVRRTGGLGDTVIDAASPALEQGTATGIVFDEATLAALADALERTAALYRDRPGWARLQRAGMASRFSWSDAAERYRALYREVTRPA